MNQGVEGDIFRSYYATNTYMLIIPKKRDKACHMWTTALDVKEEYFPGHIVNGEAKIFQAQTNEV